MAEPRPATESEIEAWTVIDGGTLVPVVMGGPEEGDDVIPCPCLVGRFEQIPVVHVAYRLDEIEVAALALGGTLWLTTYGGLPVHRIEVTAHPGSYRKLVDRPQS